MLNEGYIKCANPKGNPKLYYATDKPFLLKNGSRSGRNNSPFNECRVHNCNYAYRVVIPPKKPIKEANKSNLNRGVIQYDLFWPFEIIGDVKFRFIVGNKRGKLIIWMPKSFSINMTKEQLPNYENIIFSHCQQCANWFMERYLCRLEPIGLHQKPHFANVDTIESRVLNEYGNFSSASGSVWVDCSTGVPEWETDKVEYAILKMDMPEIIYKVMGENMELKKENNKLRRKLDC